MLLLEKENVLDKNIFLLAENKTLTYEEVFHSGNKLFNDNKKELVLILCDKDIDTIITYVGALRHNKVPLLLDKNYKQNLINDFISNYAPAYIFCSSNVLLPGSDYKKSQAGNNSKNVIYQRKVPVEYNISDELVLLIPTSGSTGDPKTVRLSAKNVDSCTQSICEYLEFDQHRTAISFLPIHYSYGLSVLHNCIYKRAKYAISKLTMLDKALWDDVKRYQVTDFSGVPFMMKLLRRMQLDPDKIKSLKCITQAGGYLAEAETSYLYKMFSTLNIRYFTMYGQTEASPRISYLAPEFADSKLGTVGTPISCGQTFIHESNEKFGIGELGYIGPNVALGYAKNYKELELGDELKGRLLTGDIVEIDSEGFIKIIGRNKRFIKIAGISTNLDKLEKDLNELYDPIVVIGKDDKLIVLSESDNLPIIKQFFDRQYNFNKAHVKVKHIEEIPFNNSGKTDYKLLTEIYC